MKPFVLAAVLIVTGSRGLAATPSPARVDDASIKAWLKTHIKTDGWTVITADQKAVALGSPQGVARLSDGLLQTEVRREYYGATDLGRGPTRSLLMKWNVDCAERRIQIVEMNLFKDSNLVGPILKAANPLVEWTAPTAGSQNEKVMARVCDAPATGKLLN